MAAVDRRERAKQELRQLIVDTAREMFVRHGYENVSMRKIADAVEYSPAALYLHFPDKDSLMHEVCMQAFAALGGRFSKLERIDDPVERIRRLGHSYILFAVEHPNHYRLMFMTPPPQEQAENHREGDPADDGYGVLRASVAQAIESGAFRDEHTDVELVTQTLWAGVHGVASLEVALGGHPCIDWRSLKKRSNALCDVMLEGFCKPGRFRGGKS